ncbi:unnamed protein product [Brachionus calyciflorus]|uniref:Uncharacterized protein n=1 Tax=Brachionus calyciflorus TaxID=104777 RepID=A0A813N9D0_9BILA|nr:unnamed protein product [Brachionus calyciflorus]
MEITTSKTTRANESPLKDLYFKKDGNGLNSELSQTTKDLFLRDLTLKFIQNISIFVKLLNGDDRRNVDGQLKEIIQSLEKLIEAINNIEIFKLSQTINDQVDELEKCLNTMIYELKMNRTERVISSALEMARNANELFLAITRQNISS